MAGAQIGHNSAAYGEELCNEAGALLDDDNEKLFHYAKWHIGDYIAGTVSMKLETEGAYIRFLMRLYQRGKPLPDDDRFMSACMNLSIRVWRRIKDSLVSIGKIIVRAGCLTNARFEKERKARAEQLRNQAQAAHERWRRERAKKSKSDSSHAKSADGDFAKFGDSFGETSRKLSQNTSKKSNENNENRVTTHMPDQRLEPISIKEIGSESPSSSVPEAAPADWKKKDADTARLNGAPDGSGIQDGEVIEGPGFRLDLKAAEMELQMACIPICHTRSIAEIVTRDWISNKFRPRSPIAAFRTALAKRKNAEAVDQVRLASDIKRVAQTPQLARLDASYERMLARKKAREQA